MTPRHGLYVAYYRVSTLKQGASGLGLDAQRQKVNDFLDGGQWQLVETFTETESGRRSDRPELAKALAYCKRNKGVKLIVATLSRLTRDTRFLLTLLDSKAEIVFADLPQVPPGAMGRFFLTQMVAVAELEAGLTSERTKAALAAAKRKGVQLGNPRLREASVTAVASIKRNADTFAKQVLPVIRDIQVGGAHTLRAIAEQLTIRRIATRRGGNWDAPQVRALLLRSVKGHQHDRHRSKDID
jgi:DNA invertase Pin-like site-specific DNA recombinase